MLLAFFEVVVVVVIMFQAYSRVMAEVHVQSFS